MPLPEGFSAFEHLQDVYRKTANQIVRERFKDLGGEDWDPDITTSRGSLRHACTHQDTDSGIMTQMRTQLLYLVMGEAEANKPPVYGMPCLEFHQSVEFFPQVTLWFRESAADAKTHGRYPLRGETSYRILDDNLTKADALATAHKIKTLFADTNFYYDKGTGKFSYIDQNLGYRFILTCHDEQDARKVIEQVMDIRGHSPDWERLTDSQSNQNFTTKKTKRILDKTVELPQKRQVGRVHFTHAEMSIWGLTRNVILVDTTRRYKDALVYA
jgi:hypothetical protein